MYLKALAITALFVFLSVGVDAQRMNNTKLKKVVSKAASKVEGPEGQWEVTYKETTILIVTDEKHNRMRMITPIAYVNDLDSATLNIALQANFHSVLDSKYAISKDIMWSVFIHPLKELTEEQVLDALEQVSRGAATFGTTFTSTDLVFPGN